MMIPAQPGWRYVDSSHSYPILAFDDEGRCLIDDGRLRWATPDGLNEWIVEGDDEHPARLIPLPTDVERQPTYTRWLQELPAQFLGYVDGEWVAYGHLPDSDVSELVQVHPLHHAEFLNKLDAKKRAAGFPA